MYYQGIITIHTQQIRPDISPLEFKSTMYHSVKHDRIMRAFPKIHTRKQKSNLTVAGRFIFDTAKKHKIYQPSTFRKAYVTQLTVCYPVSLSNWASSPTRMPTWVRHFKKKCKVTRKIYKNTINARKTHDQDFTRFPIRFRVRL